MQELNLFMLLNILAKRVKWILLAAVVVAGLFGGYVALFTDMRYASTCSMYMMNLTRTENGMASVTTGISTSSLEASQRMLTEYVTLLRSNKVVEVVRQDLENKGYTMSNREIVDSLSMSSKDGSALLQITVITNDPNKSKAVCESMMDKSSEVVWEIMMKLGSVTPVDQATMGKEVRPPVLRSTIIGFLLGFVLSYGVFVLLVLLDNTVSSEQDLKNRLGVTVLGSVPDLNPNKKAKGGLA